MNYSSYGSPPAYNGILNPLYTVSKFCLDSINLLIIQFQYLELFSPFPLMVQYLVDGRKRVTLFGALNCFRNITRLSISSTIWLLGFLVADIMDSSFDDIVVDLSSGGGREGHIKMTSSFSSLFSFREIVGLTYGREMNWLVWANDYCSPQIWLSITGCPWPWHVVNLFTRLHWILWNYWNKISYKMSLSVSATL